MRADGVEDQGAVLLCQLALVGITKQQATTWHPLRSKFMVGGIGLAEAPAHAVCVGLPVAAFLQRAKAVEDGAAPFLGGQGGGLEALRSKRT
jgi:hypothetical protein